MFAPKKKTQDNDLDSDLDVATDPGDNLDELGDDLPPDDDDDDNWNEDEDEDDE